MKLFTLNTHSFAEVADDEEAAEKRHALAVFLLRERPDVMAFQEINQPLEGAPVQMPSRATILEQPVRAGNYLLDLSAELAEDGWPIYWAWAGFKRSWDRLCEGVALASPYPLLDPEVIQLSRATSFTNWRHRKAVGARIQELGTNKFYSVHFGWYDDEEDPFTEQFERVDLLKNNADTVWLMGDFNVDAAMCEEGYGFICEAGWHDSFELAEEVLGSNTAAADIDGWRERPGESLARRIDYVFASRPTRVRRHRVCLDGTNEPCVSDHFGLLVETDSQSPRCPMLQARENREL